MRSASSIAAKHTLPVASRQFKTRSKTNHGFARMSIICGRKEKTTSTTETLRHREEFGNGQKQRQPRISRIRRIGIGQKSKARSTTETRRRIGKKAEATADCADERGLGSGEGQKSAGKFCSHRYRRGAGEMQVPRLRRRSGGSARDDKSKGEGRSGRDEKAGRNR